MKKIHYIPAYAKILSAALFLAVGSTSCTDILEKQPPSSISDGNFWTGEGDAKLALTGCYRFESGWGNDSFDHPQGILYLDLCGGHGSEKEGFTTLMEVPAGYKVAARMIKKGEKILKYTTCIGFAA